MEVLNLKVFYEHPREQGVESEGILITVLIKGTEEVTLEGNVVYVTSFFGLVKGISSQKLSLVDLDKIHWAGKMLEAKYHED